MDVTSSFENRLPAVLFREPRRGVLNWALLGVALLYTASGLVTMYRPVVISIPIALLWTVAEVLPEGRATTAGILRTIGLAYIFLTPALFLIGSR